MMAADHCTQPSCRSYHPSEHCQRYYFRRSMNKVYIIYLYFSVQIFLTKVFSSAVTLHGKKWVGSRSLKNDNYMQVKVTAIYI